MIEAVLAGLFGLLIGSFLNVCIYRMPRDLSVVRPRSHCPGCGHTIAWYDNVPIVSYLLLHGRCRYCSAHISVRYPIVEGATGLLFFLAVCLWGPNVEGAKYCCFAAILVGLGFTDLEERILPDEFTLGGVLAGIAFAFLVPISNAIAPLALGDAVSPRIANLIESAGSAALLSLTMYAIGELYLRIRGREGLGFGDVKMLAAIGAFLGLQGALFSLMAGSILGSVCGIAYIKLARKEASSYQLPFGTFLAAGALLACAQTAWLFPVRP